jgi:hypothetical protein
MQFRKKPVVVEADQWFPGANIPGVQQVVRDAGTFGLVKTSQGEKIVHPGDWVVTEPDGQKRRWYPEEFEATYERVA